ncbi:hypothetical protein Bca52824_065970 [Brassica carinata]|uniref:Protein kinase domain-containing protein n=1 Tax=Brassica carinata TaxID=52824 RepID=A0A8X7QJC9_BRACI|nr:hypothetical protein Bca52824_065970 [Brassica carinata]
MSTCRDATYAALASRVDGSSALELASCFFNVPELSTTPEIPLSPEASPVPVLADSPSGDDLVLSPRKSHHAYRLTVRKKRELDDDDSESKDHNPAKTLPSSPRPKVMVHEAVKRMNKSCEQADDEFCREIELLARLHHRHLVALKGFCTKKNERFLVYEYMANGSLTDHLHSTEKPPLSWATRMKIAIDVANALEYLHLYCDPPLCHRDIKSSNILLDENFVAKLADFGLAHASRDGSVCFEPINTDIRGTPESRRVDLVDSRIKDCIDGEQLETVVAVVRWCTEKEGVARPSIKQVLRLLCESCDPLHMELAMAVEEHKGRSLRGDSGLASSSSTTSRSHCSRSFLLETGSPPNGLSF